LLILLSSKVSKWLRRELLLLEERACSPAGEAGVRHYKVELNSPTPIPEVIQILP